MSAIARSSSSGGCARAPIPKSSSTSNPSSSSVLLHTSSERRQAQAQARASVVASANASRREALVKLGAASASLLLLPVAQAAADEESAAVASSAATTFEDAADGFALAVPAGWATGEGSLNGNASFSGATGSRRAVAFFEEDDPATSVVVVVGNTSAEFTKLGAFGTAATFGSALVNSMDRSNLLRAPAWVRAKEAGPGGAVQVARLLDAKEVPVPGASGGEIGYLTDYTVSQVFPDQGSSSPPAGDVNSGGGPTGGAGRRLLSVAALHATPKGFRRIVTVTAQTPRGEGEEARVAALRKIVQSFRIVV